MRSVNVLHIINSLETGGAERLLLDLTSHFKSETASLTIAYLLGPGTLLRETDPGCEVFDLSSKGRFSWTALWRLQALMRRKRIDILHTHDPQGGIMGRTAAWLAGVSTIVSTRHMPRLYGRHPLVYSLENRLLRTNALVIAISQAVKASLVEDGVLPPGKIEVIPNCVDTAFFSPEGHGSASGRRDPFRVRAVGRLEKYKGFDVLIQSMAILSSEGVDATLEIAGEGPQHDALMSLIRSLRLENRVGLSGRLDRLQLKNFLADADVCVLPSRTEGFGLSLLEAMAMGKAVVGSRIEGIGELVRDGVDGLLFIPSDSSDLADRLRQLARDPALCAALGTAGRQKAVQHHSLDHYALQIARVYEAIMNQPKFHE